MKDLLSNTCTFLVIFIVNDSHRNVYFSKYLLTALCLYSIVYSCVYVAI